MRFFLALFISCHSFSVCFADNTRLEKDVEFLNEHSHNGMARIKTYDIDSLDLIKEAQTLYEKVAKYGGCYSNQLVVIDPDEINHPNAEEKLKFITSEFYKTYEYTHVDNKIIFLIRQTLNRLLMDKENRAIVFSGYNPLDETASCTIYYYKIFRNDGKKIEIYLSFTD